MNNSHKSKFAVIALMSAALLGVGGCANDKTEPAAAEGTGLTGTGQSTAVVVPGVAGGSMVDSFTATATVTAIDKATRKVSLKGNDGATVTFAVPVEARNFDQIKVGDSVTATITETLTVFVRSSGAAAGSTGATGMAIAPKGAKPGVMIADAVEIVAKVKSIDTATRKVMLEFEGGDTRTVTARPDVDLSKYKAGDSAVFQLTQSLSVIVASAK